RPRAVSGAWTVATPTGNRPRSNGSYASSGKPGFIARAWQPPPGRDTDSAQGVAPGRTAVRPGPSRLRRGDHVVAPHAAVAVGLDRRERVDRPPPGGQRPGQLVGQPGEPG